MDKDEHGRAKFRPVFRVQVFGKILLGLREWSSAANCVLESVDDLPGRFRDATKAHQGKIPIVELAKTIPVVMGRGARQRTVYTPCLTIVGWTDRNQPMGTRLVPPPKPPPPVSAPPQPPATPAPASALDDDEIPF